MTLVLESTREGDVVVQWLLRTCNAGVADADVAKCGAFTMPRFGTDVPAFAMASYHQPIAQRNSTVEYLPGHGKLPPRPTWM